MNKDVIENGLTDIWLAREKLMTWRFAKKKPIKELDQIIENLLNGIVKAKEGADL